MHIKTTRNQEVPVPGISCVGKMSRQCSGYVALKLQILRTPCEEPAKKIFPVPCAGLDYFRVVSLKLLNSEEIRPAELP
jgi:hypothetical protein